MCSVLVRWMCTVRHSWQHAVVVHMSLQTDCKAAAAYFPVFGTACPECSLYLSVFFFFVRVWCCSSPKPSICSMSTLFVRLWCCSSPKPSICSMSTLFVRLWCCSSPKPSICSMSTLFVRLWCCSSPKPSICSMGTSS